MSHSPLARAVTLINAFDSTLSHVTADSTIPSLSKYHSKTTASTHLNILSAAETGAKAVRTYSADLYQRTGMTLEYVDHMRSVIKGVQQHGAQKFLELCERVQEDVEGRLKEMRLDERKDGEDDEDEEEGGISLV